MLNVERKQTLYCTSLARIGCCNKNTHYCTTTVHHQTVNQVHKYVNDTYLLLKMTSTNAPNGAINSQYYVTTTDHCVDILKLIEQHQLDRNKSVGISTHDPQLQIDRNTILIQVSTHVLLL